MITLMFLHHKLLLKGKCSDLKSKLRLGKKVTHLLGTEILKLLQSPIYELCHNFLVFLKGLRYH